MNAKMETNFGHYWRAGCVGIRPSGSGRAWQKPTGIQQGVAILLHKNNPQAASSVVMGLIFISIASSVASLITFS